MKYLMMISIVLLVVLIGCDDATLKCINECEQPGERKCDGPDSYKTCDNIDEDNCFEWDGPDYCGVDQYCDSETNLCVSSKDPCTLNEKRCLNESNAYQVCESVQGNLQWSTAVECRGNTYCRQGECVACTDACVLGRTQCSGTNATETCIEGPSGCAIYDDPVDCEDDTACSGGKCLDPSQCFDECVNGQNICDGNAWRACDSFDVDTCDDLGAKNECPDGQYCSNGSCDETCTNECSVIGVKECYFQEIRICGNYDNDSCLDWSYDQCDEGESCSFGECTNVDACSDECNSIGSTVCANGNEGVQECGQYDIDDCLDLGPAVNCPSGQSCVNNRCACECDRDDGICNTGVIYSEVACDCDPDCDSSTPCGEDGVCDHMCPNLVDPDCQNICSCDLSTFCDASCNFRSDASCDAPTENNITCDCDPDCRWHRQACMRDGYFDSYCPPDDILLQDPDEDQSMCESYIYFGGYLLGDEDDDDLLKHNGVVEVPDGDEGAGWAYLGPKSFWIMEWNSGQAEVLFKVPAALRNCMKELRFYTYGYDDCWWFGAVEGAEVQFKDWQNNDIVLQEGSMLDEETWNAFPSTELDRYLECNERDCSFMAKVIAGKYQCTHLHYMWLEIEMQ